MTEYVNQTNISLPIAVWLATDSYDGNSTDPYNISATSIMKSVRQIVLARQQKATGGIEVRELSTLVASRMGTAYHDSIEHSWVDNYEQAMKSLGYPPGLIKHVLINPKPSELYEDCCPIYLEQRAEKKIGKWTVTGKYDMVTDGMVNDIKSTGTYTYEKNTNEAKYRLQGSIYRWLNPTIITGDHIAIQYIFTDWQALRAKTKGYPSQRCLEVMYPLHTLTMTDNYIKAKLVAIDKAEAQIATYTGDNLDEYIDSILPECSDEDLWRKPPAWKYYSSGKVTARSTKNFTDAVSANNHMAEKGKGIVVESGGEVVACKYCDVCNKCGQRDRLKADGSLK